MAFGSPSLENRTSGSAQESRRKLTIILLVIGALLLGIGAVVFFWSNGYAGQYQSIIGQLGRFVNNEVQRACVLMEWARAGGVLAMGVSAVVILAGVLPWVRHK